MITKKLIKRLPSLSQSNVISSDVFFKTYKSKALA